MNSTMNLIILSVFDVVVLGFGVYLLISGTKMRHTKEPGTMILSEEEVKKCVQKEALAEFFFWREILMGVVFILYGVIRLLDKFVLKIGGILDIALMVFLLITAMWFYKSLMTARAKFLS